MTTAADTFAEFLATLAETLDLGGDERARRLHLSRFHLARVVSAAGGEPPERMRRRLLLERAAYRLLTCDEQVVDLAFEAGYGSHEAFTRAFAREYGTAPSRWRQHPTRTQIEGPSGVHFHPPGSLRLPTSRKVTPMDLMTRMIEHHVWLTGEMIERATRLADEGPAFLAQVRTTIEEGRLDDTFVDVTCEPPRVFTYGGMVAHVLTFAAVRRLVVLGAFETLGITDLDAGDPMEWVGARPEPGRDQV